MAHDDCVTSEAAPELQESSSDEEEDVAEEDALPDKEESDDEDRWERQGDHLPGVDNVPWDAPVCPTECAGSMPNGWALESARPSLLEK